MSDRQRLRREKLERKGPLRNWSTLYGVNNSRESRDSSLHQDQDSTDETEAGRSWDNVVTSGVELGYRVVEEHIRQGQRVAQQINNRSYDSEAMGNDIRELIERMVHYYTDLGSLWGDLANSFVDNPGLLDNLFRRGQGKAQPGDGSAANGTSPTVPPAVIEVASIRPAQVTLDLQPHSERLSLMTYGLHAGDPQKPPLTDITFEPSPEGGRLLVRLRIPHEQPPDVYTGVVVDKNTNLPKGTLSVRIVA